MSAETICACDDPTASALSNPPGQSHLRYRVATFREFRRALLRPIAGETELSRAGSVATAAWRPAAPTDLAVMMMEWWAYVADVLTFYNERIANQAYLRTGDQPESVPRLIHLLGYRPRPALGAVGMLAALVSRGSRVVLPKGLPIQSKPGPGQSAQTFELDLDTLIGSPDTVRANPAARVLVPAAATASEVFATGPQQVENLARSGLANRALRRAVIRRQFGAVARERDAADVASRTAPPRPVTQASPLYEVLVRGGSPNLQLGMPLLFVARDPSLSSALATTLRQMVTDKAPNGATQTRLLLEFVNGAPSSELLALSASQVRLQRASQASGLWSFDGSAIDGSGVHLNALARSLRPNDPIVFTAAGLAPELHTLAGISDAIRQVIGSDPPLGIPHAVLTLDAPLSSGMASAAAELGVVTVVFGWIDVGVVIDPPPEPFSDASTALFAVSPDKFIDGSSIPVLIADAGGQGVLATGSTNAASDPTRLDVGSLPEVFAPLVAPLQVLYNLLPVSRGKTVANELLGSGDATVAGQDFTLSQSPVTYLTRGAGYGSTVSLLVSGQAWTEVEMLFGQPPDAHVFVTREDEAGKTHVHFGDGQKGARLPTGVNNVIASYRVGAGAASPATGKLTVLAKAYPGLRSLLNPVAVSGGADPEPPEQIARYAPRSVLTFGRAVSVFDYEAIAAQAPGVNRARAIWAWNDAEQRPAVTVYVGDDAAALTAAQVALQAASDPNRPVSVLPATQAAVTLTISVLVAPNLDSDEVTMAVQLALIDPTTGLFAPARMRVGQTVFDSQIIHAVLAVDGVVAIEAYSFAVGTPPVIDPRAVHIPDAEGGYFAACAVNISTRVDSHG